MIQLPHTVNDATSDKYQLDELLASGALTPEEHAEALARQAVTMALCGDTTALRLCLERIAPPRRDAPVTFDLPRMKTARDAATAAGAVLEAVALGDLTPTEGAHIMGLVETYRRTLETSELEARLAALEGGNNGNAAHAT